MKLRKITRTELSNAYLNGTPVYNRDEMESQIISIECKKEYTIAFLLPWDDELARHFDDDGYFSIDDIYLLEA